MGSFRRSISLPMTSKGSRYTKAAGRSIEPCSRHIKEFAMCCTFYRRFLVRPRLQIVEREDGYNTIRSLTSAPPDKATELSIAYGEAEKFSFQLVLLTFCQSEIY